MSRYINADAIDYKHHKQHKNGKFNTDLLGDAKTLEEAFYQGVMYIHNCIEETPTADVIERKHGRWIDTGSGQECSICKEIQYGYDSARNYCANCGADMKGEKMTRKEAIFELIKIRRRLEEDSTIDAEPFDMAIEALAQQHGKWLYLYEDNYKCSICGSWWCCIDDLQMDEMNYCPNCGAMMSESLKVHEIGKILVDGIQAGIKGEKDG